MTAAGVLYLLIAIGSRGTVPTCDLVEINHCYNDGRYRFTQLIAWDWSPDRNCFDAQQWVFVLSYYRHGNSTMCRVSEYDRLEVRSRLYRETWTDYDPEQRNLAEYPHRYRRKVW